MQDNRTEILKALVTELTPIGLPVFSVIPQDYTKPYIYIGDLFFNELDNKDAFLLEGILTVELITGSNEYMGSISEPLEWYNDIKLALQPRKTSVLIDKMIYMKLLLDSGVQQINSVDRIFIGTLQYEFQLQQDLTWLDLVYTYENRILTTGGIFESSECLLNFNK